MAWSCGRVAQAGEGRETGLRLKVCLGLLAMFLTSISLLPAQAVPTTREYPPQEYYLAFQLVRQGDYVKGAQAFRSAARSGIRTTDGAWIDAVCYHAMIGECLYQMGDLPRALEQFTNAETLLVAHGNWMLRVDFPPVIEARNVGPRTPIAWGSSSRRTQAGRFPTRYPILQGRADVENVLRAGGILAQQEFFLINAHEVVRCGALAIRRRAEILGQTSPHDPLHARLLELLVTRPTQPNHWSGAWIDALLRAPSFVAHRTQVRLPRPLDDDRITKYLAAIAANNNSIPLAALAERTGEPADQLRMVLAVVQRLLNLDGAAILTIGADQSVTLDRSLLALQFGIDGA